MITGEPGQSPAAEGDGQGRPAPVPPPPPAPDTRRLSPVSCIAGAVRELAALLVVAVSGLLISGFNVAVYFTLAAFGMGLLHQAVRWWSFTYTLYPDRVELRHQLIGRSVKTIPLERIRGVDITASPAHRLLGLAVVRIDAAAGGDEGILDGVARGEAERLRARLLGRGPVVRGAPRPEVIARSEPSWYWYAPLSGAYLLTPFALAGSLLGTLYNLSNEVGLISEGTLSHLGDRVLGFSPVAGVVVALLFVLAMPLASVLVFAWFNWDFQLRAVRDAESGQGALLAERGLVSRRSVTLEKRRIRGVELRDNPLERMLGVVRLTALVTGLGDAEQRGRLLPTAPRPVAEDVIERIAGPFTAPLAAHPPAARTRRISRAVWPPLVLAAAATATGHPWLVGLGLVAAALGVPLGLDRYRQLGHATDGRLLSVRSGSLVRHQEIIENRAVVGWKLRQSVFQRRGGVATLTVAVGAGEGGYAIIDAGEAEAVAFARSVTPAWVTPFLVPSGPGEDAPEASESVQEGLASPDTTKPPDLRSGGPAGSLGAAG
ncbi:putative membrane protein [Actinocorallia herbida]|uniref:Putative membrane protein n=1 Tax=Actinocorallia herbida TaxID=58109 RepID=A0A3N1D6Y1_9ACTN|nr:PH domain-containing protein [Actinocorallia herbida]ROO89274.1 putative membrane protein [Actinocorallia herbida]